MKDKSSLHASDFLKFSNVIGSSIFLDGT